MSKQDRFLVFRYYSQAEAPTLTYQERTVFYGWTDHKSVLKAFLAQRDRSKYVTRKIPIDEAEEIAMHGNLEKIDEEERRIDFIQLQSSVTKETVTLFMTSYEMQETEKDIQSYFRHLSSIDPDEQLDGSVTIRLMNLFLNIEEKYGAALDYIGFRPSEIDAVFDDADDSFTMVDQIDQSYSDRENRSLHRPKGVRMLLDDYSKVIYSLESFVRAMKRDL